MLEAIQEILCWCCHTIDQYSGPISGPREWNILDTFYIDKGGYLCYGKGSAKCWLLVQ